MKLGAHVSAAGGIDKAIDRAQEIGAEAVQIFASSPRGWAFKPITDKQIDSFRARSAETGISAFQHGIYLVNLGGGPELLEKSIESLTNHMNVASKIGSAGVIFHCGSHKGVGFDGIFDQAVDAMKQVLDNSPDDVWLMIENSAGMGAHIGASFKEIGALIKGVDHPNIRVCIDTEHAFAAGYNIADPEGIEVAMQEFDQEIGLSKLAAVHANDAKVEFASGVDRHENIGEGHIGIKGFETIMGHPAFRDVPFLLEVPGQDKKGPDKENLDRLKEIRERLLIPA
jgi:deoxyribonuclease-4